MTCLGVYQIDMAFRVKTDAKTHQTLTWSSMSKIDMIDMGSMSNGFDMGSHVKR